MSAGVLPALILFDGFEKFHKVTSKIDLLNVTISSASMNNFCQSLSARHSNLCQATHTHTHINTHLYTHTPTYTHTYIYTVNTTNFITQIKYFAFNLAQFPYYSYAPLDCLETLDDHLNRGLITAAANAPQFLLLHTLPGRAIPPPPPSFPSLPLLALFMFLRIFASNLCGQQISLLASCLYLSNAFIVQPAQ